MNKQQMQKIYPSQDIVRSIQSKFRVDQVKCKNLAIDTGKESQVSNRFMASHNIEIPTTIVNTSNLDEVKTNTGKCFIYIYVQWFGKVQQFNLY